MVRRMLCMTSALVRIDLMIISRTESQEPSFLRKLKSQYAGRDGRHENPQARPKRLRDEDDDDDDPVYVDGESNETLSRQDYQALSGGNQDEVTSKEEQRETPPAEAHPGTSSGKEQPPKEPSGKEIAGIGLKKKFKKAKAIGEDVDNDGLEMEKAEMDSKTKSIKAKRKKIVKLSFDQEE
jgi:hypothetical protein